MKKRIFTILIFILILSGLSLLMFPALSDYFNSVSRARDITTYVTSVAEMDSARYEAVWNEAAYGADKTVSVHIRHLRQKIEINPSEPRYLKIVWGFGYKLEDGRHEKR